MIFFGSVDHPHKWM